eukprot:TRINITY_DN19492_c0_g1_i1.p1 TRINITY_DN19492_c0_g1~~TRINITY_DN19492_c0_g1_i1.p1  ORF type:complete len:370 (-),score=84.87 TRINITY_DN19492_c0_g1_i1:79-1101(-)
MLYELFILIGILIILVIVGLVLSNVYFRNFKKPSIWFPVENTYIDPISGEERQFSSLFDEPTIDLSIIVPAWNESQRITVMLDEMFRYLHRRNEVEPDYKWEVIVVSDGSRDDTVKVVQDYERNRRLQNGENSLRGGEMRVLDLKINRGKGGAVRRGMMYGRGQYLLMVDADGATQFSDIESLQLTMSGISSDSHGAIVLGSRAHLATEEAKAERAIHRKILSFFFHFLVDFVCVKGVKDTQCGFKLFNRKIARILFPNQHIERWAFDVELLLMATKVGAILEEVPVTWHEIDGSKLDPMTASVQMAKDLVRMRLMYLAGAWQINNKTKRIYGREDKRNV